MKNISTTLCFLVITFFLVPIVSNAQQFWTENFNTGGANWTTVSTGVNDANANFFSISDDEGGGITPNLGAPASCGVASNGDKTLYITSSLSSGAAYNAGGLCGFGICVVTNTEKQSPTINCTGKSSITVNFNYIENGDATIDNATMYYYDGTSWSLLYDMPKTLTGCTGQGLWTSQSVILPISADNNPNVKIAFRWINNDDGSGSDPSFAVDNIDVIGSSTSNTITTTTIANNSLCVCSTIAIPFTSTGTFTAGNIYTAELSNSAGSFASPIAIGNITSTLNAGTINAIIPCNTAAGVGYRVRIVSSTPAIVGSNNGSNLSINTLPNIAIVANPNTASFCSGDAINLCANGAFSYIWSGGIINCNSFIPTSNNIYTVTGTNSNGCTSTNTIAVNITNNITPIISITSSPAIPIIGVSATYTATILPATIISYQLKWFKNNILVATNNSPNNTFSTTPNVILDSVYALLIPKDICTNPDSIASKKIGVQIRESIANISKIGIIISPNPASQIITFNGLLINDQIKITDIYGRDILQIKENLLPSKQVSIASFSNGNYIVTIMRNNNKYISILSKY